MRIHRDLSGVELVKALKRLGYESTRQVGSHARLATQRGGEHHVTIPAHDPLKVGTLNAIPREVERHHRVSRQDLLRTLFG